MEKIVMEKPRKRRSSQRLYRASSRFVLLSHRKSVEKIFTLPLGFHGMAPSFSRIYDSKKYSLRNVRYLLRRNAFKPYRRDYFQSLPREDKK